MAKNPKRRFRWLRKLKNLKAAVVLGTPHADHAGYRVVRIIKALYDRKDKQVVRLVVRLYGGRARNRPGHLQPVPVNEWNGRIYNLTDRKYFVDGRGQNARGIVDGKRTINIDRYVKELLSKAKAVPVPPEAPTQKEKPVAAAKKKPAAKKPAKKASKKSKLVTKKKVQRNAKAAAKEIMQRADALEPKPEGDAAAAAETDAATATATETADNDFPNDDAPTVAQVEGERRMEDDDAEFDIEAPDATAAEHEASTDADTTEEPTATATATDDDFDEDPAPQAPLEPAEIFDANNMPALTAIQTAKQEEGLIEQLAELLHREPKLLVPSGLPGEPRWDVKCPDGAVLDIAGYGRGGTKPIVATVLELIGYTPLYGGNAIMGEDMPSKQVFSSIHGLLIEHEEDDARPPQEPLPELEVIDKDDDYFGV